MKFVRLRALFTYFLFDDIKNMVPNETITDKVRSVGDL